MHRNYGMVRTDTLNTLEQISNSNFCHYGSENVREINGTKLDIATESEIQLECYQMSEKNILKLQND